MEPLPLDQLEANIAALEELLQPLLDMDGSSAKLPLLEQAKLNVLSAYAIQSLVFCKDMHACMHMHTTDTYFY